MTEASTAAELRLRLRYWLEGMRAIFTEEWAAAFTDIPREVFVRDARVWVGGREVSREEDPEGWLDGVYRNRAIVLTRDEDGHPTSSSSMPSIMAKMLEHLRAENGDDVLEIGTGSGYNAALLCHRLGAEHVTSIDNQAALIAVAHDRLAEIGYQPDLAVADGVEGMAEHGPYDRVIGTAYAWPLPPAWLQQTRPGGRVVAVAPGGMVGLDLADGGDASGWFHPDDFGFMYLRGHMPRYPTAADADQVVAGTGDARAWVYPPDVLAAGHMAAFNLLVALRVPYEWYGLGPDRNIYDFVSGSWVRFEYDTRRVVQGGPRRLWDEIEQLYEQWYKLGAPARERFGLTVTLHGAHTLWLDDPKGDHRWDVTPPVHDGGARRRTS